MALIWLVDIVALLVFAWCASSIFHDRDDRRWKREKGWCPTCGQDVPRDQMEDA